MKHGQIRQLYLESRLYKQSVKQETHNYATCFAKPLHTKQQQNVWQTIGPPSMRLLSDLSKIQRISKTLTLYNTKNKHDKLLS